METDAEIQEYDVVVLGGGPAGENAAQYAIEGTDLTAAIVERELLGGECSYWACMPSKALLRPISVADVTADLEGVATAHVAPKALLERRDTWVSHYDDSGQASWAEDTGIAVARGAGRLVGERTVEVTSSSGTRRLRARRAVVIATGSAAHVPDEYADVLPWESRDATGVVEVPERLVVVGGGVVACEAAVWMTALGSTVTLVVRGPRLLGRTESFAGEAVLAGLRERGITVHLGTAVSDVRRAGPAATGVGRIHGGTVSLTTSAGDLEADEVLLAIGRVAAARRHRARLRRPLPRRRDGWPAARVVVRRRRRQRGSAAHPLGQAPGAGRRCADRGGGARARSPTSPTVAAPVPQVVFSDPEVASVGMTEAEARDAGHDVVTSRVPTSSASGVGLLRDHVAGESQIVVDRQSRLLLGATLVGPEVGELVHAGTVAIIGDVPVHVLRHAVASYPTASELWLRLLEGLPRELRTPPTLGNP